jgi:hypothetical protein
MIRMPQAKEQNADTRCHEEDSVELRLCQLATTTAAARMNRASR